MKNLLNVVLVLGLLSLTLSLQRKSYLKCGEQLWLNEYLESGNGYYAVVQSDCNFVIYASRHFVARNALWSSKTSRTNCSNPKLVNEKNGNVVLYSGGKSIWSTGTGKSGTHCYKLILQTDGNLVLYDPQNKPVWNSNTAA